MEKVCPWCGQTLGSKTSKERTFAYCTYYIILFMYRLFRRIRRHQKYDYKSNEDVISDRCFQYQKQYCVVLSRWPRLAESVT